MAKDYDVRIREAYEKTVTVQAGSEAEARDIAERRWADEKYKLDDGDFVGADFAIEAVHDKSIDAMVYDYLRELYIEVRDTDIDELARICKSLDREWIEKDQKETLRMIEAVRTLVAHKL